ncbi:hypothetical protein HG530_005640 [Fusarium avenaceum]|nr:hypothetical protein HG530_005640 [Fusarium avenaceum]
MPSNYIKRTVVLSALEKLTTELIHDLPGVIAGHVVACLGIQEVPNICKTVRTKRTKLRQLKMSAPYFKDISSGRSLDGDSEALATLDDADLARLDVEIAKLGLDVKSTLLGDDQKVSVRIDKGSLFHALCCREDVCGEAFSQSGVT